MKHAKSISTVSKILIKINLLSLGICRMLVLFGNAEFMSVVQCGTKARIRHQLRRKQNSVLACLGRSLCSKKTPAFPLLRASASTTNQLDDLGKVASLPRVSVSPSAK